MAASRKVAFGKLGVAERNGANPYTGHAMPRGGYRRYDPVTGVDEGLRTFMLSVYNLMALGLVVTGTIAWLTYSVTVTGTPSEAALWDDGFPIQITQTEYLNELGALLWVTPISYLVCFGPLLLLVFTAPMWRGLPPAAAMAIFVVVASLIGVSFSGLALTYTNGSIAQMFFATASGFGSLSLFGYTTKRDLSGWGSFLWMGLFSVLAAIIINIWLQAPALEFALSVIGVLVFAGFTAYDTQMIKEAYSDRLDETQTRSLAISGALDLYLDFVNMFRFLLAIFGAKES